MLPLLRLLVIASITFTAFTAEAARDERFTWDAARAEYSQASKPSRTQIEGVWTMIGETTGDGTSQYFEGGWQTAGKPAALYRSTYDYQFKREDAFGNPLFTLRAAVVNKDVKDVYYWLENEKTWNSKKGISYQVVSHKGNTCGAYRECRFISAKNMLICADIVNDKACSAIAGKAYSYTGFLRLP